MTWDDAFIERLRHGDPAAYAHFVASVETRLYRFFFLDHRDFHRAHDELAETFSRFVRACPRFRGTGTQLIPYLYSIARRVRQEGWSTGREPSETPDDSARRPSDEKSPLAALEDREQMERLVELIGNLGQPVGDVMVLRFVEGCSIDEISAALELPIGTVKSHIHRGRIRLKEQFEMRGLCHE